MATDDQMFTLLGKALNDTTFMTNLKADPIKAAYNDGIKLTAAQGEMIKSMNVASMTTALELRSFSKVR